MKIVIIFKTFFLFFLIICVFDPADRFLSLKMPLFIFCLFIFLYDLIKFKNKIFPKILILINILFIAIPAISLFIFFILNSTFSFVAYDLFKAYILILISIMLYYFKLDFIKQFSFILLFLSFFIITIYFVVKIFPDAYTPIYFWGLKYQIFLIGERSYDVDSEKIWSIYFVTSPLLVIPISYYNYQFYKKKKYINLILMAINIFAMFIAGTRNNMLISILLPLILFYNYSKSKFQILFSSFLLFLFLVISNFDLLKSMLSMDEASNSTKIGLLDDYVKIFSTPLNLLIGQGLGASYFWESRGKSDFITELTYFEIYRSFGLIFGSILLLIMIYPIFFSFQKKIKLEYNYIVVAYFFYLVMSATNPIFFMSMGMIFFPIVLSVLSINKSSGVRNMV